MKNEILSRLTIKKKNEVLNLILTGSNPFILNELYGIKCNKKSTFKLPL